VSAEAGDNEDAINLGDVIEDVRRLLDNGSTRIPVVDGKGEGLLLQDLNNTVHVGREPRTQTDFDSFGPLERVLKVEVRSWPDYYSGAQRRRDSRSARTSRHGRPASGLRSRSSRRASSSTRCASVSSRVAGLSWRLSHSCSRSCRRSVAGSWRASRRREAFTYEILAPTPGAPNE